ncbi:unnamed protein product [Agarophyton chilense]
MRFLQAVLDGSASKALVNGAVAVTLRFRYDAQRGTWDASDVRDEFFARNGDTPPDVLGDETCGDIPGALARLQAQLRVDDGDETEQEALRSALDVLVETLHGSELTRVQSGDARDHAFHKRVVVAKWLHLRGAF